jgi:hypothetical protein
MDGDNSKIKNLVIAYSDCNRVSGMSSDTVTKI